jgi:anaerobic selenocysteine-containing dehydrogenase
VRHLPPDEHATITVHPEVAAAAGVAAGGLARLVSSIGEMVVRVETDEHQRKDVALTAKGGHLAAGQCTNALLRARTSDHGEGGALYEERVRLRPL